jgi:hypothetical protein
MAGPDSLAKSVLERVLPSSLHHLAPRSLVLLRYEGHRSGRTVTVPVQVASFGRELLVLVASPEKKSWWRNFHGEAREIEVCLDGRWRQGVAQAWSSKEQPALLDRYAKKHPRAEKRVGGGSDATLVMVKVNLDFVKLEHVDGSAVTEPDTTYGWQEHATN